MLPPVTKHMGAFPSMWDTVFPARGRKQSANWYDAVLEKSQSAPVEVVPSSLPVPPTARKKTPFDWGKVAARYEVPEWARMKHAKPYLSRHNTPATNSQPKSRGTSHQPRPNGTLPAEEHMENGREQANGAEHEFSDHERREAEPGYFLPTKEDNDANDQLTSSGNWKSDNAPNIFAYNRISKRDKYIEDAIFQTETAEEYLHKMRMREERAMENMLAKHRNRAKQIEDEVRHYFLPSLADNKAPSNMETGEDPGRLSRAESTLGSSNAGWKTKMIKRFQRQHPDPHLPISMPKFSEMAGFMAKQKK